MNGKLKDFYYILSANIINLILGFISGFILPSALSYSDYNYIKLFAFYTGYVGVMHLGFLDGIFVKFGAYDYENLPKRKFRAYLKFLFIMQIIEALILSILIIFIGNFNDRMIVNIFVVINMIIMNITSYFTFIHQITKKFKLFSINTILSKILYVVGVVALLYFKELDFIYFIVLQTIVNVLILLIYVINNKGLVFGDSETLRENYQDIKSLMQTGFIIMIGNFIALMILGIDRLFVDALLNEYDFAMYSFAYSLVSLFFLILNSLTTIVYPYLARVDLDSFNDIYKNIRFGISLFISLTLSGYFVIEFIVNMFITKYNDAIPILIFLVPTVLYSAVINILVINVYKIFKETKKYFYNNIFALIISLVTNIIAIVIYRENISIAIATLISFIIWVIYSDRYFSNRFKIKLTKIYLFEFFIVLLFIFSAYLLNWYLGLSAFLVGYLIIVLFFFKEDVINITNLLIDKK